MSDQEKIRNSLEQLLKKGEAGDFDGWLGFYAEDAIVMPPNAEPIRGKEAVRQWGRPFFDQFTIKETSPIEEVEVHGDWALMRGTYDLQFIPKKEGETIQETGKFIYTLKRQTDNSWKFSRLIWNTNSPAT